jgi:hypothetical protein
VDDAEQDACQHQTDRDLRVDAGPAIDGAVEVGNLVAQPAKIPDPLDPGQDVVVRHELPKRSHHEQLELIAVLAPQHRDPPPKPSGSVNHASPPAQSLRRGSSTAPGSTS